MCGCDYPYYDSHGIRYVMNVSIYVCRVVMSADGAKPLLKPYIQGLPLHVYLLYYVL